MLFRGFDIKEIILSLPIILMAITFHEYAHGYAAFKMGDPTAKMQGRLSLNPLSHMDIIGALSMLLLGFGWAKPVPINPYNFKDKKKGTALVSLAGPMANIFLALVGTLIYGLFIRFYSTVDINEDFAMYMQILLSQMIIMNISFALFNLIPIPPLDGSKILGVFLPGKFYYKYILRYERYAFPALIILMYTGIIGRILSFFSSPIIDSLNKIISLIGGI